jgi:hypothetical protein
MVEEVLGIRLAAFEVLAAGLAVDRRECCGDLLRSEEINFLDSWASAPRAKSVGEIGGLNQ